MFEVQSLVWLGMGWQIILVKDHVKDIALSPSPNGNYARIQDVFA